MSSAQAMAANLLVAARSEAHDSLIEQIRHVCPGFVVDEGEDFADALLRLLAAQRLEDTQRVIPVMCT